MAVTQETLEEKAFITLVESSAIERLIARETQDGQFALVADLANLRKTGKQIVLKTQRGSVRTWKNLHNLSDFIMEKAGVSTFVVERYIFKR